MILLYMVMKECCQDIDDIERESDSEIESVTDHSTEEDIMSITEDDIYMYNMIFHPCHIETMQETSFVSSLLSESDTEDGSGITLRFSNDYYCTNNSRCSQSSAISSQHSQTSNTLANCNNDT